MTEGAVFGTAVAIKFTVVFYKRHKIAGRVDLGGFTLVEAVVSVTLIGIGVASTLGALTKFNSIAAMSRNATGAGSVVLNQIDLFQSMSPFNPQKTNNDGTAQIPIDTSNTPPTYDMTVGTHTIGYRDPSTGTVSNEWPVYREPASWTYANAAARSSATGFVAVDVGKLGYQSDTQTYWKLLTTAPTWAADTTGGIIVKGTMTVIVTDISPTPYPGAPPYIYKAVVTIAYDYLNRTRLGGNPYTFSMTAIRTSDI